MHDLYKLKETLVKELEEYGKSGDLSKSALEDIDKLAHAAKNVAKVIEACEEEEYSNAMGGSYRDRSYRGGGYRDGRSYEGMNNRQYSRDGYYYDDGGMSNRRGRAANGRFVSRDSSEMARQLREMMTQADDDYTKSELQRLADKMEQM